MAKLNWQKLSLQQHRDRQAQIANKSASQKKLDKKWLLGKHYGTEISKLSLDYLIWASENLPEGNYHKLKADCELIRRYNKSNT